MQPQLAVEKPELIFVNKKAGGNDGDEVEFDKFLD